jgi:hypothetical protein
MVKKTQEKPELQKPKNLDFSGAQEFVKKIVLENKAWFKEMAAK